MKNESWMHRLDEWSHPPAPTATAAAALVLLTMGLVLLALGGVALSQNPAEFDLWVLAIGLYLLAGAIIGIGRSKDRVGRANRVRPFSDHASLAEAPALSTDPAETPLSARRAVPPLRTRGASDTIAGQYAEASRLRAGRSGTRYLGGTAPDPYLGSGYPFSLDVGRRDPGSFSPSPDRTALEVEITRLRARIEELEGERARRGGTSVSPVAGDWPGPSVCVGCGHTLVGGPDDARCAQCRRPLCAQCYATVPAGPNAHQCPECRGRSAAPTFSEGTAPVQSARSGTAEAGIDAPVARRAPWSESP